MFDAAQSALHIPVETDTGRKRRIEQLNWATIVRDKYHKGDEAVTDALVCLSGAN